jgi:hypothetical protein
VGRIVIDGLRSHRADDADVVGDRADVRENLGDFLPGSAEAAESMLRGEAEEGGPLQLRDRLAARERFGHWLAVSPRQLRLVVEALEVRRAAGHVEIDDAFRSRRQVRRVDDATPRAVLARRRLRVSGGQQAGQRHHAEAGGGVFEKGAAGEIVGSHVEYLEVNANGVAC